MISIARYRGPVSVAMGLGLALVLLDVGLTATVGFAGRFLPDGETATDDSVYKATWGKIARMLAAVESPGGGTRVPYGVMFGQSTLGAGIDAAMLEKHDGLPLRWFNLHGWGGSVNRTRDLVDLAYASDMKPGVVLICINPYMLVGHDFEIGHRMMARKEGKFFKSWIWIYDNRFVVNVLARNAWLRLRMALLRTFRFGFLSLYQPEPAGLQGDKPRVRLPSLTPAEMADNIEMRREEGWGDPARYRPDSSNSRSLVEIVSASRARGATVAIILMPEHSLFRRLIPPRAVPCFDEINRLNFPDNPVPIYNLRERIPDDLFLDPDHAGVDGLEPISALVGECVRDLLSVHPAPERISPGSPPAPASPRP